MNLNIDMNISIEVNIYNNINKNIQGVPKKCYLLIFSVNICQKVTYDTFLEILEPEQENQVVFISIK